MKMVLIINAAVSLLAFLVLWKQDRSRALFVFVILLFMPLVGIAFFGAYLIIEQLNKQEKGSYKISDEEEENIKLMNAASLARGASLIPVSDALVLNSSKVKKELLINVLREDKAKYIETLKTAIGDEDTEASHYAAVALMDIKDSYNMVIETLEAQFQKDSENLSIMTEYAEVLDKSILSGLNDKKRLKNLDERYSKVLIKLLEKEPDNEAYYIKKIDCDTRRKDFNSALHYAESFKKEYPEHEKPYLSLMKLHYVKRDGETFRQVLNELRKSNVILSAEGLKIIRFWLGGAK